MTCIITLPHDLAAPRLAFSSTLAARQRPHKGRSKSVSGSDMDLQMIGGLWFRVLQQSAGLQFPKWLEARLTNAWPFRRTQTRRTDPCQLKRAPRMPSIVRHKVLHDGLEASRQRPLRSTVEIGRDLRDDLLRLISPSDECDPVSYFRPL